MSTVSRAPFWLEVKKNYIVENFESLVQYLKTYSFTPEDASVMDDENSDFGRTFNSLRELAYDYMNDTDKDSIYSYEDREWSEISFMLRVMCTYLLAARIKKQADHKVLARVADILLLSGNASTQESVNRLTVFMTECIKGSDIAEWGISWKHITDWDKLSPEVICANIGQTSFLPSAAHTWIHDGHGCIVLKDGAIHIAPANRNSYKADKKKAVQFQTSHGIDFEVPKANIVARINSFYGVKSLCHELISAQNVIQPSPVVRLRKYNVDDNVIARVKGYHAHGIVVETVDSAYEKLSGKVYIAPSYALDPDDFKKNLKEGDYVMVTVQNNDAFQFKMGPAFEAFFHHYASTCDRETYGIYDTQYNAGYRWLSVDGLYVNVMGFDVSDIVLEAKENGTPVCIDIINAQKDSKGNLVVNGKYSDDPIEEGLETGEEFRQSAIQTLISAFADYAMENKPVARAEVPDLDIDKDYIRYLSHLEYYHAFLQSNTRDRYVSLFIARYLAGIDQNIDDLDYISMEMKFQECLVEFASGYPPKLITFEPKAELHKYSTVQWRMNVIGRLNTYEEIGKNASMFEFKNLSPAERFDAIEGLINSSNRLNGKINQPEINRIKKHIARHLRVEDEFVNTISDLTYYGEESDTLEFKSSAVFPPDNGGQAEPTRQLWTILKTICGFLNTLSGGELILGVKDNGNSCGLKADIQYLYKNGKITEESMDKYRNYIKMSADKAFLDDIGMSEEKEITTGRINYIIERNKENHDILRVQVRPYEYGVVLFKSKRPDYIEQGYVRTSGATVSLTDELKLQTRERKMRASYDDNLQKLILLRQACKEKKQVLLKGYSSKSGTRDRVVEPYKLLSEHDAFLCYDTTVDKHPIREFKVSRIGEVHVLDKSWSNTMKHRDLNIDVFGMLQDPEKKPYHVKLKLAPLAYNLLREEYKNSEKYISANEDAADKAEYPWVLDTSICKDEGVGRFYIGLANSIKIVEGRQLMEYVQNFVSQHLAK